MMVLVVNSASLALNGALLIGFPGTSIVDGAGIILVLALLPLKALEVRVL